MPEHSPAHHAQVTTGPSGGQKQMTWIDGGSFTMGSDNHYPEEAPTHRVSVAGFFIDPHPVTNAEFARFVSRTRYVTVAERTPGAADYPDADPDKLVAGSSVFVKPGRPVRLDRPYQWWHWVPGANWRHPQGPGSSIKKRPDHPVVHIAWADVTAYAEWSGKDIPTEAEWEYACRGGLDGAEFAWGNELEPGNKRMANTWHGEFPHHNTREDRFETTSPVGAFPANGYGLVDMIGNVWEWTGDWYASHQRPPHSCCAPKDPRGGTEEDSRDPTQSRLGRRVIKGGSHLCAPNYCRRYRPAARMAQTIDTSTSHLGFRLVIRP
ncbi:formylglycine-generating enzyme family protein [Nocardia sp. GTS18]|uniref:formylglycine-generating enzyme family protein n=1 Tax=Nocardia sp. GTS18 TaxID=1778064 RepID=UPI00210442F7|nr:formylglycine-generating enzyme family protein [Nocardia sp. GTS18]